MDQDARVLADYSCLEAKGRGADRHIFIRDKNVKVIDIYLSSRQSQASLSDLSRQWGLTPEEIQQAIRFGELHPAQLNAELGITARDADSHRTQSRLLSGTTRLLIPALLFLFGVFLAIALKGMISIVVGIMCFILFLRFANEIPIFGWAWVKVFGRQELWEWLRMTIAPLAIGIVGTYVTTTVNRYQNQANIERSRNDLAAAYLATYQPDKELHIKMQALMASRARTARTSTPNLGPCDTAADSNWLSLHARSTLGQISSLEPPRDTSKTIQKRAVLEFLHHNGLIRRGANTVDLKHADLTDSVLTWADLSDSCLQQTLFIDYPATPELASDLRHSSLAGSDLTGATLQRANLRYSNLTNIDLRKYASIARADLRGANLSGAKLDSTTGINGAIVNTKPIDIDGRRKSWWYPLICNRSVQDALQWTFLCIDSIDYYNLPATELPLFLDATNKPRQISCVQDRICGYKDGRGVFQPLRKIRVDNRIPTF